MSVHQAGRTRPLPRPRIFWRCRGSCAAGERGQARRRLPVVAAELLHRSLLPDVRTPRREAVQTPQYAICVKPENIRCRRPVLRIGKEPLSQVVCGAPWEEVPRGHTTLRAGTPSCGCASYGDEQVHHARKTTTGPKFCQRTGYPPHPKLLFKARPYVAIHQRREWPSWELETRWCWGAA